MTNYNNAYEAAKAIVKEAHAPQSTNLSEAAIVANRIQDKCDTAPASEFVNTQGLHEDQKIAITVNDVSFMVERICKVTAKTQEVKNTYEVGFNVIKIA